MLPLESQLRCSIGRLPAAVTPVSPIAAVTVPAAAPSSSPSSTESTTSAPTAPAPSALRRPCFVDDDLAAHQILAVQSLYGALGVFVVIDFNKSEPAWLARETVAHQGHIRHGDSRLRKKTADILFRSLKRQITDVKFLQRKAPSGRGNPDPRDRELKDGESRVWGLGRRPRAIRQRRTSAPGASCSKFASTSTINIAELLINIVNAKRELRLLFRHPIRGKLLR